MRLRLSILAAVVLLTLGAMANAPAAVAFDPKTDDHYIVHLDELDTFAYEMHREFTGAAGQRIFKIYQDGYGDLAGFIPAKYPANGRFALDWEGEFEYPGRYVQTLIIGNNDWTEWTVNDKSKARYNDDALINVTDRRNEVMVWWDNVAEWLDEYSAKLECATSTKLINDEQAIRCTAPALSQPEKVKLIEKVGIFTDEETKTVSAFNFELWLTKSDSIPVRMDLSATAVDAKNNTFSGRFTLNIFDIDSDEITIALPR